jgi:hypothetical protein
MNIACRAKIMLIAATLAVPSAAVAQDTTRAAPWLSAFSVGFPAVEGDLALMAFTLGANFTKIRVGSLSPDFSFGTMPWALSMGVLAWGARAGLALPMQSGKNTFIVPSAGLSTLGVMGMGGTIGTNAGVAIASRTGARVGVTWHRFGDNGEGAVLLEMGVGRIR